MKFSFLLASRYIIYNKGKNFLSLISSITIGGIALGVTVLILAISILKGFEQKISEQIINFNAHINISGFSGKSLRDHDLVETKLKNSLNNTYSHFSAYVSKKVIISGRRVAEGIILTGITPEYAKTSFQKIEFQGDYNLKNDNYEVIIGKKLAEKFNLKTGNKLTVFALTNDRPPSLNNLPIVEQFKIIGIYESGMAEYDDIHAYINFSTASKLFELDNEVTGYNINLYDISKIDSVKKELNEILSYPYYVRTYRDINKHIFTWLELQQKPIPIVLGLIIIVAIFNIVGALLMMIIQKTSAIGVLRSMGATSKQIVQIFIMQGIALAIFGIILGNFLAFTLTYLQNTFQIVQLPAQIYYLSSVPINFNIDIYFMISGLGLILSFIASLIPSYIASKIQPITAIKFN